MGSWADVCYWGYGVFKLKPNELYALDPIELIEMVEGYISYANDEFDKDMHMLAWQTALLMNSTGNLKKHIKPKDLYNPNADEDVPTGITRVGQEEHERLQAELLATFNIQA